MEWTQQKLEELYQATVKKATVDAEYRERLKKDARSAMAELAGCELPEGFSLKFIEKDPSYANTFVLPDFKGDELDMSDLKDVGGGVSFLLVFSACAIAVSAGPCPADACAAAGCGGDACAAKACAAKACGGAACGAEAHAAHACGGDACGAAATAANACAGAACATDASAVSACHLDACGANACGADACPTNVCGGQACAADAGC
ncbi:MAG: hypothetical protein ABS900_09390, partial [Candidatus Limivicinus sp.]